MPYIQFINFKDDEVELFKNSFVEKFASAANANLEKVFVLKTTTEIVGRDTYRYLKIDWMPREKEVELSVVDLLHEYFKNLSCDDYSIYFEELNRSHYYAGDK